MIIAVGGAFNILFSFIPVIFTMFLALAVLEDSGYIARAAFLADRFMRALGLPGKSFVPLLVGFGCTVPAILSTRMLESRRDRMLTIFMIPFMSCGAKLPVYAAFAVAFSPEAPWKTLRAVSCRHCPWDACRAYSQKDAFPRHARPLHHGAAAVSPAASPPLPATCVREPRRFPLAGRQVHRADDARPGAP